MKHFILFIISGIFYFILGFSQDSISKKQFEIAQYKDDNFKLFLAKNLIYPYSAFQKKASGMTVIVFRITKNGNIDSISVLRNDYEEFTNQLLKLIKLTDGKWIPTKVDSDYVDFSYKMVANYFIHGSETDKIKNINLSDAYLLKKDYEKALFYINKAIEMDSYDTKLYMKRRNIMIKLKDMDAILNDNHIIEDLDRSIICDIDIIGYK